MKNMFNSYFGAANGFSGFVSYFNEIFSPIDFTRIYVLKGGPGTGKSSLMKKIALYFENNNFNVDKIYCSSDPNSLDGIIIYCENKKIAILDGTAPHETDAKIPGAIDEIINLGKMWDRKQLIEKKKEIEVLNEKKRLSYQKAYKYLNHAGAFFYDMYSIVKETFNHVCIAKEFESYDFLSVINQSRTISKRLISSFSKFGYSTRISDNSSFSERISVEGIFGSEYIFMNSLKNELLGRNYDLYIFPSPYSDNLTEAIYIPYKNIFIGINLDCEKKIDTNKFLDKKTLDTYNEMLSDFDKRWNELLFYAKKEFQNASDYHFALEAIYTPTMNFEFLNQEVKKLIEDILFSFQSAE